MPRSWKSRAGKAKKRDMALYRKARYLSAVDNGPLGRALGEAIRKNREAAGLSAASLATAIGATEKHLLAMEAGKAFPTQEAAHRIIKVLWGKTTWRDSPSLRGIGDKIDPGYAVRVTFYDKEILERWQNYAAATGCTLSAVARYALERLFDNQPTLTTIQEGVKIAEQMRAQSLLESCPEYLTILKGDPMAARLIHMNSAWKKAADEEAMSHDELLKGPIQHVERLR